MADEIQLRGGSEAENDSFTGAQREVTVDTTNKTLRVHDGTTAGGSKLAAYDEWGRLQVADPVDDSDATSKSYVDGVIAGSSAVLSEIVVIDSSATFSKASYSELKFVRVRLVGGGGAGGGSSLNERHGTSGGGGGYSEKIIDSGDLTADETVTIGVGATGGGGAGGDGGTTSFGAHCSASGGSGGAAGANGIVAGGQGGVGSDGDINIRGQAGGAGGGTNAASTGPGGSSVLGGGAPGQGFINANGSGLNAAGYGGGGNGGHADDSNVNGGDGAAGVCIVEVYT